MEASQDPSVTHLMGKSPPHPPSRPVLWWPSIRAQGVRPLHPSRQSLPAPSPTGLFEPKDMKYEVHRDPKQDPSLMEMTEAALRLLSRNPRGFYLFVEGEWQPLAMQSGEGGSGQIPKDPPPP